MSKTIRFVGSGLVVAALVVGFFAPNAQAAISTINITAPLAGDEWRGTQNIIWNAVGATSSDLVDIVYTNDGFVNTLVMGQVNAAAGTFSWNTSVLVDAGTYQVKVYDHTTPAVNTVSGIFTIDNLKPVTTYAINPVSPDGIDSWYITVPTVTLSCSDALSGCLAGGTKYRWDGGSWNTYTVPFVALEGSHTLEWYSEDQAVDVLGAHNVEAVQNQTIKVDTVAPSVVLSSGTVNPTNGLIAVTAQFDEAVTGFVLGDVTVTGGIAQNFVSVDADTYTFDVDPTDGPAQAVTIDVFAATSVDVAGNSNTASNTLSYTSDTVAPTVLIGLGDNALKISDTSLLTFTFFELPTGFDVADITAPNGVLSGFTVTGNPLVYEATFTPNVGIEDNSNVITVGTGWTDAAANPPAGSTDSVNYEIDTLAPTVTLSSGTLNPTNGLIAVTAQFSEAVIGFDLTDVTVTGGVAQNFVPVDGDTYTFNVDPTDGPAQAVTIDVFLATSVDAAGNANTASNQLVYTSDTIAPTVGIVFADTALKAGETSLVTFTFSEAVTGFTNADVTVENGLLTAVSSLDGGVTWTATFTPTADFEDATNIATVDVTGVADLAGNAGVGTTSSANYTIDTLRPTVLIGLGDNALKISDTSLLTFTFFELPTGFDVADITAPNGVLSGFTVTGNPLVYEATFTPNVGIEDNSNVITVGTGWTDAAENAPAGDTNSANYAIDTKRPTLVIGISDAALKAGDTAVVTFTFHEAVVNFDNADITAIENGLLTAVSSLDGGVTWTGTFTPTAGIEDANNIITVNLVGIDDLAGNAGVGTEDSPNYVIDTLLPTLNPVHIESNNAKSVLLAKAGNVATLTFTSSEDVVNPPVVTIDGQSALVVGGPTSWAATYTFTETDNEGTVPFTINFVDLAGNAGGQVTLVSDTSSVFYDCTDPLVNAGVDREVNATVSPQGASASDVGGSGVDTYEWTYTGPGTITFSNQSGTGTSVDTNISADTDGTYTVTLTVEDEAGNVKTNEIIFIWDTMNPVQEALIAPDPQTGVLVTAGTAKVRFDERIVLLDAGRVLLSDNSGASYKGTVAVDGGNGTSAILNINYTGLAYGTVYDVVVKPNSVSDVADNKVSTNFTAQFTTEIDTVPPVVNSFSAGSITETGATLSVTTNENATCSYAAIDSEFASMALMSTTGGTAHSQNVSSLSASTGYDYYVRCEDTSGNIMTTSAHVSFTTPAPAPDTTAPDVPVITTAATIIDANTYTIAGTAADDGGSRTITLYNGSDVAGSATIPAGDTTWAILVPLTQDAGNSFTATAADESGNVSAPSLAVVITEATATGDTDDPDIPIITTLDATVDAAIYTITGTAEADLPADGTRVITILRNGTVVGSLSLSAGETDWSFVAPLLQNTTNSFTANSTDASGNSSADSLAVVITETTAADTTAPVISSIHPTSIGQTTININWSTDEPSNTLVEYGPTSAYTSSASASTLVTSHTKGLTGLTPGTTYHYRVRSTDASSNQATSDDYVFTTAISDTATLAVTGIDTVRSFATADDNFANGWAWIFHVTVPTSETQFAMKFSDFLSNASTSSIPAAANIRYYTAQSSTASTTVSAVMVAGADAYPASITLDSDANAGASGRQIEVRVEVKVPVGTPGGSYSTSYGIQSL